MSDAAFKTAPYPAYTTAQLVELLNLALTPTKSARRCARKSPAALW